MDGTKPANVNTHSDCVYNGYKNISALIPDIMKKGITNSTQHFKEMDLRRNSNAKYTLMKDGIIQN